MIAACAGAPRNRVEGQSQIASAATAVDLQACRPVKGAFALLF